MMPILHVGPLALPLPELLVIFGLWLGLNLSEKYASKFGLLPQYVFSLTLWAMGTGIVVSRLSYIARYPEAFIENWADIFSRNLGLFDPVSGIVAAFIAMLVYAQHKRLSIFSVLDALTPAILILQVALALSTVASGKAYGSPTQLPWGVELWGQVRHPTQIYMLVASLLILYLFWPGRMNTLSFPAGSYFVQVTIFTAISTLFTEAFRGDSIPILYSFRQNQLFALIILASGIGILHYLSNNNPTISLNK